LTDVLFIRSDLNTLFLTTWIGTDARKYGKIQVK
jgi:hypothetical protein